MLRIGLLTYVGILLIVICFAERMIFFPQPAAYSDDSQLIRIETPGGERICAVHLQNPDAEFTVLVSHGNAEDIGTGMDILEAFVRRGYSVFAYDYRGYGLSEGRPSEKNTYGDIEAAYGYLVNELKVPPERIIVLGRSIGGGPSTYLAVRKPVAALIMESSFVSAFRVSTVVGLLPFDKYNNISRIDKINCPLLVIHGADDSIVAPWHSRKLLEKAKEPKLHLWVEGAGHNDLNWVAGETYWQAMRDLTEVIKNR